MHGSSSASLSTARDCPEHRAKSKARLLLGVAQMPQQIKNLNVMIFNALDDFSSTESHGGHL